MKKINALAAVLLCLFLGGCPGDDDSSSNNPGPAPISSSPDVEQIYNPYSPLPIPDYCYPPPKQRDPDNQKCKWFATCDRLKCEYGCNADFSFDNVARNHCIQTRCWGNSYNSRMNACDNNQPRRYEPLSLPSIAPPPLPPAAAPLPMPVAPRPPALPGPPPLPPVMDAR